jgi:hypothetical protein
VYLRIAETEIRHGNAWAKKITDAGQSVPQYSPPWRTRTLIFLSRRFGASMILPSIQGMEQQGGTAYAGIMGAEGCRMKNSPMIF